MWVSTGWGFSIGIEIIPQIHKWLLDGCLAGILFDIHWVLWVSANPLDDP